MKLRIERAFGAILSMVLAAKDFWRWSLSDLPPPPPVPPAHERSRSVAPCPPSLS